MTASRKPMGGVDGVNVILLSDGRQVHFDDMTTASEGQACLDDLDGSIDHIEGQLDAFHAGRFVAPDPDWPRRAGLALKRKRRMRPRLERRIADLRRAERQAAPLPPTKIRQTPIADLRRVAFINAAEALLDADLFTEIWSRAAELEPTAFAEGGRS